ncbi:MAG: carboxypeptidase regulatory-like domain-containing protein [Acidobacteriaceae bacterium]
MNSFRRFVFLCIALLAGAFITAAAAQPTTTHTTIHGTVTDPTGAVIPNATVSFTTPDGHTVGTATSDATGSYQDSSLAPGMYIVIATSQGFAPSESKAVTLAAGQNKIFNISLKIAVEKQKVVVNEENPTVSVSPTENANSLVLKGKDLDALSDDPDELANELQALAGPSAGPNGGQIYIDGFTGGQLPPKSAIREIRVNRNPFSAEYDKLGYGRIEILTKPGSNQFHGNAFVMGNPSQFNTGNPFNKDIPDYYSYMFAGSLSGPISKHASFSTNVYRRTIQDASIVTAFRLAGEVNGNFANGIYNNPADYDTVPFNDAVVAPQGRLDVSQRVDLGLSANNTLTVRYNHWQDNEKNSGIGQFSLPDQATNSSDDEDSLQVSDTQIFSPRVINETWFELRRDNSSGSAASTSPLIQVSGMETFGGAASQSTSSRSLYYEVRNLTELALGKHSINIGGRLRVTREASNSNSGFNGTFTFGGLRCSANQPNCTPVTAAENYGATVKGVGTGQSWAQIQAAGGGASQLNLTYGNPKIVGTMADVGLYYQDDWSVRPNLTLSYGVRWESQTGIPNKNNWAPRFSFAYALGNPNNKAKTVIRGGYGLFYDRFDLDNILQVDQLNDSPTSPLHEAVIESPTCYFPEGFTAADLPSCGQAGSTSSKTAVYEIGPNLHAPVSAETAVGVSRQVTKDATVTLTYVNTLGQHQVVTRNANAPQVPGYDPSMPNIYQYYSEGVFKQNQLIANFNSRIGSRLSLFGFYSLSYADSDGGGNPSNSANLKLDYGRPSWNAHHRIFLMGDWAAPWNMSFSPFVVFQTGQPFNITLGQDVNGDSFFNDRPSFAKPGDTDTISTQYGTFNLNPGTDYTPIPINYGNGPNLFTFNLRAGKSFAFGPEVAHGGFSGGGGHYHHGHGLGPGGLNGGGGPPRGPVKKAVNRRFNMTLDVQAENVFNIINLAPPTGVLGSPNFGQSNALAGRMFSSGSAARRIDAQLRFSF